MLKKSNAARAMLRKRFEIHEARHHQMPSDDIPSNEESLVTCRNMYNNRRFHKYIKDHKGKRGVVLTARVHPGESNASFIMEGLLDYLLSPEAKYLRSKFIFKVLPMLNPDGVIYGNYRCSLLGVDLNRRWPKPSKWLHPPIYYTKQLIAMFHIEREVELFCDIHGHSRKKNVFMYGCAYPGSDFEGSKKNNFIKILPLLLSQRNKCFSFKDCTFACEKEKESTARIVVFKELGITHSYTLEASFFGALIPAQPA